MAPCPRWLLRGAIPVGILAGANACTTDETGFIDLNVASVSPPHKPPKPPPPHCTEDSECTDAKRPRCDDRGECVACLVDDDCQDPNRPRCFAERRDAGPPTMSEPPPNTCVECATDVDCTGDPERVRCATAHGKCVACVTDFDCAAVEHCEPDGLCRPSHPDGG